MNQKRTVEAMFVPHIEAKTSIGEVDEILKIDGLQAIMIAMTDMATSRPTIR